MSNSKTAAALQQAFIDSYGTLIENQRFHWNFEGADFFGWHKLAELVYDEQFTAIDEIAERLRALDKKVDISPEIIAKTTNIKFGDEPKDFLAAQEAVVASFHKLRKIAGAEEDTATEDLANNRIAAHDKNIWMIKAHSKSLAKGSK